MPATRWPHFSASVFSSCPHDDSSHRGVLQPPIAGAPVAPLASNDHHGGICPCRFALRRRTSHDPGGPAVSRGYPYLLRSASISPGHLFLPGTSCSFSFWPKVALLGSSTGSALLFPFGLGFHPQLLGFALLFFSAWASTPQLLGLRAPPSSSPLGLPHLASRAPPSSSPLGLPPRSVLGSAILLSARAPRLRPPLLRSGFHPAASRAPPSFSPLGRPPRSVSGSALLSSARASTPQLLGPHLPPFLRTTLVDVLRPHSGAPGTFSHGVSGLAPPSS